MQTLESGGVLNNRSLSNVTLALNCHEKAAGIKNWPQISLQDSLLAVASVISGCISFSVFHCLNKID